MKLRVGDRVKFNKSEGTVVEIVGDMCTTQWDDEINMGICTDGLAWVESVFSLVRPANAWKGSAR